MQSNYKSKTPKREKLMLEFIRHEVGKNPGKETFLVERGELARFDPLLGDMGLLDTAFENISKGTGGNVKIDFRDTNIGTTATGDEMTESKIHIFVEDTYRLDKYYDKLAKELEDAESAQKFVLDQDGNFYPEGGKNAGRIHHFRGKESLRIKVLTFLAEEKTRITTQELARHFGVSTEQIYGAIEEVKNIVAREMLIPRNTIFDNDPGEGYLVTNVILEHD